MPLQPAPPSGTQALRFDMGYAAPLQTQAGYTSVLPSSLYVPGSTTFGWNAGLYAYDRGALASTFGQLLRDAHWHYNSRTFTAEVADGWYLVSVKLGDVNYPRDQMRVRDASTGDILLDNVATPAGEVAERSFVVQATGGKLALEFSDRGGDPYWSLSGVDIWPAEILTIGSPDPGTLVADGETVATFTGYGATPGALVTVSAELDVYGNGVDTLDGAVPIISTDVDPDVAGVQVWADGNGQFTYSLVHPSAAGVVYLHFAEVSGANSSCQTLKFDQQVIRRFDMDGGSLYTSPDFRSVRGVDLWELTAGYGWSGSPYELERSASGILETDTALFRDGHWDYQSRTFQVQAIAGQSYDVRVYTGDANYPRNNLQIQVEGAAVPPLVHTAANEFAKLVIAGGVDMNNDGILTITFTNLGGDPYWVVNGIDVARSGQLPPLPDPSQVSVSVAPDSSTEGDEATVTFTVSLTQPQTYPITVAYAIGGTATPGVDYTDAAGDYSSLSGGTISFAAGQTSKTIKRPCRTIRTTSRTRP